MGTFSDLLDGMTITAHSPDRNIECELEDGRHMTMSFTEGSYGRYRESALSRQLSSLLTSLWVGHQQARDAALSDAFADMPHDSESAADRVSREFAQERDRVRAEGRSRSGRITISTVGRSAWTVAIAPGAVAAMDEDSFLDDLWSAFLATMTDFRHQMAGLKREKFGERMDFRPHR